MAKPTYDELEAEIRTLRAQLAQQAVEAITPEMERRRLEDIRREHDESVPD